MISLALSDVFAVLFVALREAMMVVAFLTAISCLDDLAIDLIFFARHGWLHLTARQRRARREASRIDRSRSPPIAIFVPAWDEQAVVGDMLRHLTSSLDYRDYRVFVGVYPNDPGTAAAVDAVGDPRVRRVSVAHPGPTTKADCLNALWIALLVDETREARRFLAVVLHDAEDVIHPDELHVFAARIPRLAMVQLPVVPLTDQDSRWVAGHYLDEFAEGHTKEMVVRAALGAAVPSAGVACAIDRDVLGAIAAAAGGRPFDPECLTEDYELGHRIHAMGCRGALVRIRSGAGTGTVATREHFPGAIDAAVRQKSRWLLGIALQGWDRMGWTGDAANRWMLVRDRKGPATAVLTLAGYATAAAVLALGLLRHLAASLAALPPLIEPGSPAAALLAFNLAILGWRLLMRMLFTGRTHGWRQGLLAAPRAVVANAINFLAAARALRRYVAILSGRERLSWDKTRHLVHRQEG